jgi:hypothetical protein
VRKVRSVHVLTLLRTGESLGTEPDDFETEFAADKFRRCKSPGILMKFWQN